jgi:hypothetical protein
VVLAPFGRASSGESIAVVVSSEWPEMNSVSMSVLRRLYLGKLTRVGSVPVVCIDFPSGSAEREAFSLAVLGKSEREMHEYWIEQALTGGELPPREVHSARDVIKSVADRVGRIGYVRRSAMGPSVPREIRILQIVDERGPSLPGDEGYPIRLRAPEPPHEPKLPSPTRTLRPGEAKRDEGVGGR